MYMSQNYIYMNLMSLEVSFKYSFKYTVVVAGLSLVSLSLLFFNFILQTMISFFLKKKGPPLSL